MWTQLAVLFPSERQLLTLITAGLTCSLFDLLDLLEWWEPTSESPNMYTILCVRPTINLYVLKLQVVGNDHDYSRLEFGPSLQIQPKLNGSQTSKFLLLGYSDNNVNAVYGVLSVVVGNFEFSFHTRNFYYLSTARIVHHGWWTDKCNYIWKVSPHISKLGGWHSTISYKVRNQFSISKKVFKIIIVSAVVGRDSKHSILVDVLCVLVRLVHSHWSRNVETRDPALIGLELHGVACASSLMP